MATEPTQGEWKVVGYSVYADNKMILMAAIKDVPDVTERMANLSLAAAAKEMLSIAKQVLFIFDNTANYPEGTIGYELAQKAKAVIKKATHNP